MVKSSSVGLFVGFVGALVLAGCTRGALSSSRLAAPPTLAATGLSRCALAPSQLRPLVVEWSGADRGSLEVQLRQGPVVVRYEGCELEVLPGCSVPGKYVYSGFSRKQDSVTIRDADELYARMPLGADELEARLARAGELHVELNLVGQYLADRESFTRWDLQGQCRGASHVILAAQVGAFELAASSRAEAGVAGLQDSAGRELLNYDGNGAACAAALPSDTAAPSGCSALLRVEFTPLTGQTGSLALSSLDLPPTQRARVQGYTTPDFRRARRWTVVGASLIGLSAVGVGMVVGGFSTQAYVHGQARSLDPHAPDFMMQRDALRTRELQLSAVGFVGIGMAALLPWFGGLALDYGLSMMRAERVRSGPLERMRVAPMISRGYGGLALSLQF